MLQAPSPTNATVSPALTLALADREQVGQQLAGVELVCEGVDHRNPGVLGHLVERGLRVGAPHDDRCLPPQHPGDVRHGLPLPDARQRPVDHHRVATESLAMPAANDACVRSVGLS